VPGREAGRGSEDPTVVVFRAPPFLEPNSIRSVADEAAEIALKTESLDRDTGLPEYEVFFHPLVIIPAEAAIPPSPEGDGILAEFL
jgi:hypothetical protein